MSGYSWSEGMWDTYAKCTCGKMYKTNRVANLSCTVCPKCGENVIDTMKIVVARYFYVSKWWNPSTWGVVRWEIKE